MRSLGLALLLIQCILLCWPTVGTTGPLRIDITKDEWSPVPIALPLFVPLDPAGEPGQPDELSSQVAQVVSSDLERSGLFRALNQQAALQPSDSLWKIGPRYHDWRVVGAEALVSGATRTTGDKLSVEFYLYDVFQSAMIGPGKRFSAPAKDWRHVAHRVADEIYSRLTGEKGYFTSRIAFIAQQGTRKWVAIMDQDGANLVHLTKGEHLALTPRFSPNGEELFYISYEKGAPHIFRWSLYSGKKQAVGKNPGLNSTPAWSPDSSRMALTLSKDGNPEIYLRELDSQALRRLTNHRGIDTSPSWSPDGQRIVFNSDRGGTPQLYIMNVDGGEPQRLTFDGRYNAAPAWSPRGDRIAFVKGGEKKFRIAVTDPEGKNVKLLTDSWMDESPAWAPNGRVILFSRQQGDMTRLYTIDFTGNNERLLPLPDNLGGSDPHWSPLIR
jgi:TolB protein